VDRGKYKKTGKQKKIIVDFTLKITFKNVTKIMKKCAQSRYKAVKILCDSAHADQTVLCCADVLERCP